MSVEDELANISADLVSEAVNHPFVARLFSSPEGQWMSIEELCCDLPHIIDAFEKIKSSLQTMLQITWLKYPSSQNRAGFCVIVFLVEDPLWNSVALYNKAWFVQRFV